MHLKRTAWSWESKSSVWAQLNECAVVGDRVPGTDSTPLPLICGTVCRTACADAAYHASTFWLRWEADRHDNHHLRTHSHSARRRSHAAKQTDWLSTPTHTESATQPAEWGTTAMIIRALTETQGARLSLGFLTLIKTVPLQYAKHFSLSYARSMLHTPRRTVTNSKPLKTLFPLTLLKNRHVTKKVVFLWKISSTLTLNDQADMTTWKNDRNNTPVTQCSA